MAGSSSRRGQTIIDLLLVVVILFTFAIVAIFGKYIMSDINDDVQADPAMSTLAKTELSDATSNYPSIMDNAFVLFLALLWVALIVTSFLIDSHPIFFIITVLLLVFVFIVGMVMSNAFQDIAADESLGSTVESMPMMKWVFENFLPIIIMMGFTTALALYTKARI